MIKRHALSGRPFAVDDHGPMGRIPFMIVWIVLAGLFVVALAWGSREADKGWESVRWGGIVLVLMILLAGGFLGRQAGLWYGGYRYRQAQEREGVLGNIAMAVTNQEEKLRAEWGKNGGTWGVILVLVVYGYQDRPRSWLKRCFR